MNLSQEQSIESENQIEQRLLLVAKNLISNFDQTLEAMGYIEGAGWLERQRDILTNQKEVSLPTSVAGAQKFLEERAEDEESFGPDSYCVYGQGGFHRYWVMSDGEVIFDSYYAQGQEIEKAKRVGFKIR